MVPSKKTVSMEIQYETYGIPQDCEKQRFSVNNVSDHMYTLATTNYCASDCLCVLMKFINCSIACVYIIIL